MKPQTKKAILAWSLYDWANSAFPTVIITFVFAAYFTQSIASNKIIGTAEWGNMIAISGIVIAILSPIFGAIADHEGRRKPWIAIFSLLTIVSAALLWFAMPGQRYVHWTLAWVMFGIIGLEIGAVFYNSMLKDLVSADYVGRVSGWAWGFGYVGGLACLVIALFAFVQSGGWLGLDTKTAEQIRICGPFVAVWFFIFAIPLFIFTPDKPSNKIGLKNSITRGCSTLWRTLRHLPKYKNILKFLLAHMLYIDGLNTLFAFGGIYAAGTFGMSFDQVIQFGIGLNITAGIGAISFAWLDDWIGAKPTILLSLGGLIICATILLFIHGLLLFWLFALTLGLFVGPVQAASRSLMVRLVPEELTAEMFGLYAFSGKATAFLGPLLLGMVTLHFHSQRAGMATVAILMLIGGSLLLLVRGR